MKFIGVIFLAVIANCLASNCPGRKSTSKLFCYYSKLTDIDNCYCTHAILPANSDVKAIDRAREHLKGVKILITVNEFNQGLINLLKNSKVDGLEINLKKLDSKNDISEFISTIRSKLGSDLYLALSVPSKADILAKYYDFKSLSKHADLFILQTAFLGASRNVTFHPSRLSGMWDMQNTDSVVDLVSGLGAPLSKLVITAPVQAFQFTLQNEEYTAPGSPALEIQSLTRNELCDIMNNGANWTLERDEDQAGPYIFSKKKWIAFEDSTSMEIKAKYSRVRGLAGMALKDVSQDGGDKCGPSILEAAYNGLSRQARAPRGAVLQSLEREIRETRQPLQSVHVSPYRISRVIDVEGKIHAVRQDTRTEFECSRQGYFVHPRSCNRFYRCVKFNQLVDDFNVFEFDCPAGLAFDERVEVCVWPGSLPHSTPCSGSSEIAPVPRQRFDCPAEQGYYADPENCRWFFACLDHGKSPLTAYEFRCPFGLVFDSERLLCEWPWLVPKCGGGLGVNLASEYVYGGYSSGQGTGIFLEQYDGLGSLGTIKLGGIAGRIEQPVARVYTNVGTSGLGYNGGGYVNQGGYIVGNDLGALSYKATQSLQNAGLLRTDLGLGTGLGLGYQQGNGQNNHQYSEVGSLENTGGLGSSAQYEYNSGFQIDDTNLNIEGAYNTKTANDELNSQYVSGGLQTGVGLDSNVGYNNNAFGTKLSQGQIQYQGGNILSQGGDVLSQGGLQKLQYKANLDYNSGQNIGTANTGFVHGELNTLQSQEDLGSRLEYISGGSNNLGATSSQSFSQYHNQDGHILQGSNLENIGGGNVLVGSGGPSQNGYQSNLGTRTNLEYNLGNTFGLKLNQGQVVNQERDYNLGTAFGDKFSQTLNRYQSESTDQGVAGNINIVGGGYSAVGEAKSGIEISANGANIDSVLHSTPSPITVTTFASVPTVTSVPIPSLKTASGFESYKGGVVANVPELQYKIQDSDVANISASFVKFISSTPSTLLVNEGYNDGINQNTYNIQNTGLGATSYSYQSQDTSASNGGIYPIPSTIEQGITISGYSGASTVRPLVPVVQQNAIRTANIQANEGYVYSKPSIAFEEGPVKTVSAFSISSTTKPITFIRQQSKPVVSAAVVHPIIPVQPVVQQPSVSTYEKQDYVSGGYRYEQPAVVFQERQQPQVIVSSTPATILKQTPQVYVTSTAAPIVQQKVQIQPAVSSYSYTQNVASDGYDYPRPSVAFEERPLVQQYQKIQPVIISKFSIRKPITPPATVTTYNIQQPAIVQPTVATYNYEQEYNSEGYQYTKPSIRFEETPVQQPVQPAVVSAYPYQQPAVRYGAVQPTYLYQKPAVTSYTYQDVAQKTVGIYKPNRISTYNYATSTPRPVVLKQTVRPVLVSSYSYTPTTTSAPAIAVNNIEFGGYDYPKPEVTFSEEPRPIVTTYENRQPVNEVPFVKKKAYVTGEAKSYQYNQRFEVPARPVALENYQAPVTTPAAPVIIQNYQVPTRTPAPVIVENYQAPVKTYSQAVDTSGTYFYNNLNTISSTPIYQQQYSTTPIYQEQVYVHSTPRPTYKSIISSVLSTKTEPITQSPNFYYYDSRLSSTPTAIVGGGYSYPKPNVQFEERPFQPISPTTHLPPTREYLPSQTSKPISRFSFSSLDTQYQTVSTPRPFTVSTTPLAKEYIPLTTKVHLTTPQPVFVVPEISPTSAYVPVKPRIRLTTSLPVREYLPVAVTTSPILSSTTEYVSNSPRVEVTSRAPLEVTTLSRNYLPIQSRVRVTDAPLVLGERYGSRQPAKVSIIKQNDFHPMLTAKLGAQCTCVSNTLNLRKKQKIIIVDDDDDDDGYITANEGGKVIENYEYNPQDTVEITPTPQIYLQSATSQTLSAPNPTYAIRKRVRVRPVTSEPVTEAVEVFLKNDIASVGPSDGEIVNAVRTGLKLVKQAAKEGAAEALTKYGRANVRDTIDCQRAGLFRHPAQCNKFYACRWDCTKNKFTLHTFNCPVHLTFDNSLGACNWPSQGPACLENTLLPSE